MSTPNSFHDDLVQALGSEYEILRELGRGGASIVYLARDTVLGREVAIKVIRDGHTGDAEAIARFEREARTLASLQHPNIVMLYSAKPLPGGSLALVMQHGTWNTLKTVIREQGPLPIDAVRQVLHELASALVYLHRHQVIHRDIKPENIFIESETGRALLADFGIAKSGDARTSVTLTGVVIGTPAYMSPEQIDGGELTGRSDLYSLGMVGYEMLTGVRPWDGESLFSVIYKQKTENLPSLSKARPDTPDALVRVIERATEKAPEARLPSAQDFLRELNGVDAAPAPAPVWADLSDESGGDEAPVAGEFPTLDIEQALAAESFTHRERGRKQRQRLIAAVVVMLLFGGGAGALAFSGRDFSSGDVEAAAQAPLSAPEETSSAYAAEFAFGTADTMETEVDEAPPAEVAVEEEEEEEPEERAAPPARRQPARNTPAPARRTPPPTQRVAAVEEEEEEPEEIPAYVPPAVAPALSVTRPRTDTPTPTPLRELENRPTEAAEPPRLRNREQVGELLAERYPSDLRTRGIQGTTIVTVLVSPSGSVERSSVVTSSGNSRLDQAALAVASRMQFSQPQGATQQPTWVAVPLTFKPN